MTIHQIYQTTGRFVVLLGVFSSLPLMAQQHGHGNGANRFPRYTVKDLGTLGGTYSFAYNLNDAGVVTGGSDTPTQALLNGDPTQAVVNAPQTAFFSGRHGLVNLGTLGGENSAGAATNLSKMAVIDSETGQMSRNGEDVCGFGTHQQCLAAIWKHGRLTALPLLPGGNNSYALDMNDSGQVVGFSDTGILDLDCAKATTAGFQFRAVVWGPNGHVRQLSAVGEDTVAFALGINDRGQVVGGSGTCGHTTPPPYVGSSHAVLWERDGTPNDLGSLAGGNSTASAINNRGDVGGNSETADGVRPFLWTPETRTLIQLNPPDGFPVAIAPCCKTINDQREIVGFMFDTEFNQHAFLWKDGLMVDLNDLIPRNSPWMLEAAAGINDSGQIAGQGLINGEVHAFLATPCGGEENHGESCKGNR